MAHIRTVGIVGRGIIGSSWALVFARAGLKVRIWCRRDEEAAGTLSNIAASIRSLKGTGLDGDAETLTRVSAHASLADALTGADFVQELVPEDLALKHQILRDIEACTRPDSVIGSSTSGIMPSRLARVLTHPDRFLVVHPLTPPHLLPITELCAAPQTSETVVAQVRELIHRLPSGSFRLSSARRFYRLCLELHPRRDDERVFRSNSRRRARARGCDPALD